jgi:hypothetical protein
MFLTMSHWSSGLPVCFPSQGTQVQIPRGVLMWNRDSPVSASLGYAPTMCKSRSTWSHSFPVPVSRSLQVSLLASQPMESAAGWEPCGEPAISYDSHHVSLVQWTSCLLPVTRDTGSNPLGGLMWNRDSPDSVDSLQADVFFIRVTKNYGNWLP